MTSDEFKILLPTLLPMEISELPLIAAIILTVASGALVPKATIFKPTSNGEISIKWAIADAPSTKKSAPFINKTNPITSNISAMIYLLCFLFLYCISLPFYRAGMLKIINMWNLYKEFMAYSKTSLGQFFSVHHKVLLIHLRLLFRSFSHLIYTRP